MPSQSDDVVRGDERTAAGMRKIMSEGRPNKADAITCHDIFVLHRRVGSTFGAYMPRIASK